MLNIRRPRTILLATTLLLGAACGGGGGTDDDAGGDGGGDGASESVTLAFVGAQTGEAANLGVNISNAVELAVEEANAKGDLPVEVKVEKFDTQGSEDQGPTVAQKVIADDAIVGVVGPAFSGETKAATPIFEEAGVPIISASATNPKLSTNGWKVFHRALANDDVQGSETANYLAKGLKATSVAYVHDNTEYGLGIVEVVRKKAGELGVKEAVFEAIDPKGTDFGAAVNKVKSSGATVVYYAGYYNEAGRFVKQLRDAEVTATFLSGDGSKDPGFVKAAGAPAAEGAELTCPCADAAASTDPASVAFTKAYTEKFDTAPGTYSGEAYDSANIFLEAIRKGNTTRADILTFINDELGTFKGITKDISFTDTGEITTGAVYVFVVKDGKITVKGVTTELAS